GPALTLSEVFCQSQIPRIAPISRYDTIANPRLMPRSLLERPSKIAPDTPVVMRNPNHTRNPTTMPPRTPAGNPTLASRPYSRNRASTKDAMNEPTNPATNPFGACLRIASLSASVFPSAAIPAFPNTGPAYQMPPITKLRIVDAITAMKKLPSNMIAMSLPPRRRSSRRGYNFSATFMDGLPSLGRSVDRVRGLRSFPRPQGRTWTPPELGTD